MSGYTYLFNPYLTFLQYIGWEKLQWQMRFDQSSAPEAGTVRDRVVKGSTELV